MNSSTLINAFGNHLLEMFNDVLTIFPGDIDIKAAILALEHLKKSNPKLLISSWQENVVKPYCKEINKGDIQFLVDKDYNYDLQDYDTDGIIRSKIETLREPIKNMSKTNKSKVVKYVQNLTKISNLYFNV